MGHWVQARRGFSVVHLQIALLILVVIVAGVLLTYYVSTLPIQR
jgi:Tfp pilus assembly protein PilW